MNALDLLGRDLVGWVFSTLAWTAALLAAALVADRLLRRWVSPSGRMLLFAVVLVRVVLPTDFSTPLSLAAAPEPASFVLPEFGEAGAAATPISATSSAAAESSAFPWGVVAVAVYGVGAVLLASGLFVAHRRAHRRLHEARERVVGDGAPVLEHESAGPLAIAGRVVIPRRLFDELDEAALRSVVAHERAHLRHHDPTLGMVIAALCVIAWPVLPVWIAAQRIRFLMELRADAAAIEGVGASGRAAYRSLMLRLAATRWRVPIVGAAFGPVSALEARLAALGHTGLGPVWLQLAVTLGVGVGFLCCTGRAETESASGSASASASGSASETESASGSGSASASACAVPILGIEREPTDPELVALSAHLRTQLATADAAVREHGAREVAGIAAERHLPRVVAEARLVLGRELAARGRYDEAETELAEAAWTGASQEHDGVAAVAAGELVTLMLATNEPDEAMAWHRHAVAAAKRIAGDAPLPHEERMLTALVAHHERRGDLDEARAYADRLEVVKGVCR